MPNNSFPFTLLHTNVSLKKHPLFTLFITVVLCFQKQFYFRTLHCTCIFDIYTQNHLYHRTQNLQLTYSDCTVNFQNNAQVLINAWYQEHRLQFITLFLYFKRTPGSI